MQALTVTVQGTAANARAASELALAASGAAGSGGQVVQDVVLTMERILEGSRRMADIISAIDALAFQTNILALNAAVEAARAGEQGRGFAVVAAEVRTLAQSSASAAQEIRQLIVDAQQRVEAGSRLAGDAGLHMERIVGAVQQVAELIGAISSASQEQSSGIAEVNGAIGYMDQVTQQNAALVEQAAAAAGSMKEQAAALAGVVGRFTLQAG
jgi:methyl-accepting chemotaxis protein